MTSIRKSHLAFAGIGLVTAVYAVGQISARKGTVPMPPTPGFVNHTDPAGFTVQIPEGWQVSVHGLGDVAVVSPDGQAAALIRARPVRGVLSQWLAREYSGTEPSMHGATTTNVSAPDRGVARATMHWKNRGIEQLASVVAVQQGPVATVFVGVAPADRFSVELPKLSHTLESFRFTPPPKRGDGPAPSRPKLQYVQWVEPNEQAFAFDIPSGWQPAGGVMRQGSGVRVAWQITAPGQTTFFFGGDQSLPAYFVLPNETALSLGNREGYPVSPGGPIMLRFQDAASMGRTVLQQRFGQVQVLSVRERPDLMEILRRSPIMQGAIPAMSAAELAFRLPDGRNGMLSLTTEGQQVGSLGGTWYVSNINGFVAPPERTAEAALALARAIGSSRENPQWRAGEADHQARMTAQYQQYQQWSSNLQQKTIEQRWASDQARQGDIRDILGGTVRLRDPKTGESFETGGQSRYYYRVVNAQPNAAVGTDVDFTPAPEIDMRRMLQIGVDIPRE
ncbi:MAG: hypothetical protein ABI765_12355 [Gemmatimonadota bacterium]